MKCLPSDIAGYPRLFLWRWASFYFDQVGFGKTITNVKVFIRWKLNVRILNIASLSYRSTNLLLEMHDQVLVCLTLTHSVWLSVILHYKNLITEPLHNITINMPLSAFLWLVNILALILALIFKTFLPMINISIRYKNR